MTPERYQTIKRVFQAASERPPEERPDFLAEACAGDNDLLKRVEALLAADQQSGDFLDAPAYEVAADLIMECAVDSLAGTRLGPYQIVRLLGSGGMGDVYLAKDTRLGRRVALKLLPQYLTDDESRVRRFKREARAASSLNHPNLVTIYEIEQAEGRHFISMEYVEGKTLRELIQAGPLDAVEAMRITGELAGALSKAHLIGIVHRDIKPENIMVDVDGRVRILDFGLAKQSFAPDEIPDAGSTAENTRTQPGLIMGTTAYMSPEQARGFQVDERSDIWSLGVVLYELTMGSVPFPGSTRADVLVAILDRELPPLTGPISPALRSELQRILARALAKDPAARYQTAAELASDLVQERHRTLSTEESVRSQLFDSTGPLVAPSDEVRKVAGNRRRQIFGVSLALALILVGGTLGWRWYRNRARLAPAPLTTPAPPELGFAYWIEVQKYRDGKPFEAPFRLGREINFEKDYRIRLNFRAAQPGHLYLINEGPAGQTRSFVVLFPSGTANQGDSRLAAQKQVQIPEQSWVAFDSEQGTEKIWVVYSPGPIPELEALKRFTNPVDRGLVSDPVIKDSVASFFTAHQNERPSVNVDSANRETEVKSTGGMIVYLLGLEHH